MMKTRSARLFAQELSGERGEVKHIRRVLRAQGRLAVVGNPRAGDHLSNLQSSSGFFLLLEKVIRVCKGKINEHFSY